MAMFSLKIKGTVVIVNVVLIVVGCVKAEINQKSNSQNVEHGMTQKSSSSMENWRKDCSKSYSSMCLKLDVISFVDRLAEQNDIGILPGVSVIKQNSNTTATSSSDIVANLARDFPNDADKRMDAYLLHTISTYLNSHAISIKLFDPKTFEATKNFNEAAFQQLGLGAQRNKDENNVASARKKDKGGSNGMMAGIMMMKGTLGALGFGALAMLAGKALMTGLLALMLSAIVGLKSLHHEQKTTYEIISKPVHTMTHAHSSEEHHGGYAAYGRSVDVDTVREAVKEYGNVRDRRAVGPRR